MGTSPARMSANQQGPRHELALIRAGDVPIQRHVTCTDEREFMGWPLLIRVCPHEGPLASLVRAKVFLRHPAARLLRVSPCGPGPQTLEDGCIHFVEDDLTHHMAMIVRPPANHRVEL